MTLPPLFWPWDYFETCVGNIVVVDICLRWTIERHMWQLAIVALLIFAIVLIVTKGLAEEKA